jgi:hypothetical protein
MTHVDRGFTSPAQALVAWKSPVVSVVNASAVVAGFRSVTVTAVLVVPMVTRLKLILDRESVNVAAHARAGMSITHAAAAARSRRRRGLRTQDLPVRITPEADTRSPICQPRRQQGPCDRAGEAQHAMRKEVVVELCNG